MRGLSVSARKHTFDGVPADIAEYCLRLGQPVSAKRGDILVRQGVRASRCFYVRQGYAKVTSTSRDGHQILLGFVGPKDLVGQSAATPDLATYLATTVVVQPMELVCWTRDVALEISMQYPDIHARLDALLARNVQMLLARLHTVGEGPVPRRLASALIELGESSREGRRDRRGHRPTRYTRRSREFYRQQSLHGQPRPGAVGDRWPDCLAPRQAAAAECPATQVARSRAVVAVYRRSLCQRKDDSKRLALVCGTGNARAARDVAAGVYRSEQ